MSVNDLTTPRVFMPNHRLIMKIIIIAVSLLAVSILVAILYFSRQQPTREETTVTPPLPGKPMTIESATISQQMIDRMRRMAQTSPVSPPQPGAVQPVKNRKPDSRTPPPQAPQHTFRKSQAGPATDRPGSPTAAGGGASTAQKGAIPELSLDLAGYKPEHVAEHFGFVLAAQSYSDDALLGIVDGDRLAPLSKHDLGRFASRGRSADGIQREFTLKRQVAEALGKPFDDIGLMYLVPKEVDRRWVAWQEQVVRRAGYTFDEIVRVDARYGTDFSLQASALIMKDGSAISVEGGVP